MLDEPLLVRIRYLSETLNRANPPCKLLMLESYGNGTQDRYGAFERVPRHKQFGDGREYYRFSDCSSNRLLPHFVTDISVAVLE